MTSKSEMIILPTETFSCISHAANSFVKEEKFTRRKENHFLFENSITGTKRICKINSHLSTKEVSPSKYRQIFLEKNFEVKQYKEDSDKKLQKNCSFNFIADHYTILNTDNSYYDLSDISSLNLNTSKEESSSDNDDAIEFHIKN